METYRPISWFGRWTKRQISVFKDWLEDKWREGKTKDSDFKMDAEKLTTQYPPFLSKIRSYVPGLDETAKVKYFTITRTIPFLKKAGFEGVRGARYWKQESFDDLQLVISDHEKRIVGSLVNLEKMVERQSQKGTITVDEREKLLIRIKAINK